jgi:Methyltransferase domain/Predicted methyltransferase regulatory domain
MRHFVPWMAPAVLDLVALLSNIEPPDRRDGFSWCELGCGYADTGLVLAATHPTSEFHGIDFIAENIRDTLQLSARAGVNNLFLHALDFADAIDLKLPRFDYIVAHGVYSWIGDASRKDFCRFIDRYLAPGGLVAVSYNAMPGWAANQVFQYLVCRLAASAEGDSLSRYRAAEATILRLTEAGAIALKNSPLVTAELGELHRLMPAAYFPLEYLQPGWRAFYVTEIRSQMAEIGLEPVGSARLVENFDTFVLQEVWQDALAEISEPNFRPPDIADFRA